MTTQLSKGPASNGADDPRVEQFVRKHHPLTHPEAERFLGVLRDEVRTTTLEAVEDGLTKTATLVLAIADAVKEATKESSEAFSVIEAFRDIETLSYEYFRLILKAHPEFESVMARMFGTNDDHEIEMLLRWQANSNLVADVFTTAGLSTTKDGGTRIVVPEDRTEVS